MTVRKIVLHSPRVDRKGDWHDAGETLIVGAEDNEDAHLSPDQSQELLDSGRAVTLGEAAEEAKADPVDPLDHDRDGTKGGSLPGEQSTRARGAAKAKSE
jgi:hypothetical protein